MPDTMEFSNYLTVWLWSGSRNDEGGHCEHEENEFGADVHVQDVEGEGMGENSCAATPRIINLISCSTCAANVVRFPVPLRRAMVETPSALPSQGLLLSMHNPWIGIHST